MGILSGFFAFMSGTPALIGLLLTALIVFLTPNWRLGLSALLIQYLLIGLILSRSVRIEIVVIKILVGALAVVILYLSARRMPPAGAKESAASAAPRFLGLHLEWLEGPLGFPLRLLAVLLMVLAMVRLFVGYKLTVVPIDIALMASWLGGMGLLSLILSGDALRAAVAVLTLLAGFDLVYTGLDRSLAIVGFLSAFYLLAALAFSYLITVHCLALGQVEDRETES